MIITLNSQFDTLDKGEWMDYVPAIENLIVAHIHGWHVLVLSRSVLDTLSQVEALSLRHRTVLDVHIREKLSTLAGQAASVSRKIECCVEGACNDEGRMDIIQIPLSDFNDIENCFKSSFLVENAESDGKFYVSIAQMLLSDGQMLMPLAFDYENGGGSTTAAQARRLMERPRPLLVVVDSDRSHPDDREGDTARQVRSQFEAGPVGAAHKLIVTPVRSVENFVPPSLGAEFLLGKPESLEVCAALATLDELEADGALDPSTSALCYINLKKGIKVGAYRKGKAEFRDSVRSLSQLLGIGFDPPADNDNARDEEIAIPGVHKKFIEYFVEALERKEFSSICKDAFNSSRFSLLFGSVLNEIVAFGMSGGRIPVNISDAA